jgi:hypothetical protein
MPTVGNYFVFKGGVMELFVSQNRHIDEDRIGEEGMFGMLVIRK